MGFFDIIWSFIVGIFSIGATTGALGPCTFDSGNTTLDSHGCFLDDQRQIGELKIFNGTTLLLKSGSNITSNTTLLAGENNLTILEGAILRTNKLTEEGNSVYVFGTLIIEGELINDSKPPNIICSNCHEISGSTISFNPEITDPEPSSGIGLMKVCLDSSCNNVICSSSITSCSASLNNINIFGCVFDTKEYWIYAEDNNGNSNIVQGGSLQVKKALNCPCTFSEECYSGICKGSPSICQENPVPEIELD